MALGQNLALVFDLEGQLCGLPGHDVVKVVDLGPLSRLPRLPDALLGISHHRGRIITVVDLAFLVRGVPCAAPGRGKLILVEVGGRQLGLLVAAVHEMIPLDPSEGSAPLGTPGPIVRVHLHREKALHMLDTEQLLSSIDRLCQADVPFTPRRGPTAASVGI